VGRVGIGTDAPGAPLHVHRNQADGPMGHQAQLRLSSVNSNTGIELMTATGKKSWLVGAQYNVDGGFEITPSATAIADNGTGGHDFRTDEGATPALTIASSGSVGIGTTAPVNKLDVAGNVREGGVFNACALCQLGIWASTCRRRCLDPLSGAALRISSVHVQVGTTGDVTVGGTLKIGTQAVGTVSAAGDIVLGDLASGDGSSPLVLRGNDQPVAWFKYSGGAHVAVGADNAGSDTFAVTGTTRMDGDMSIQSGSNFALGASGKPSVMNFAGLYELVERQTIGVHTGMTFAIEIADLHSYVEVEVFQTHCGGGCPTAYQRRIFVFNSYANMRELHGDAGTSQTDRGSGPWPTHNSLSWDGGWDFQRVHTGHNSHDWTSNLFRIVHHGATDTNYGGPYFVRLRSTSAPRLVSQASDADCTTDCSMCPKTTNAAGESCSPGKSGCSCNCVVTCPGGF